MITTPPPTEASPGWISCVPFSHLGHLPNLFDETMSPQYFFLLKCEHFVAITVYLASRFKVPPIRPRLVLKSWSLKIVWGAHSRCRSWTSSWTHHLSILSPTHQTTSGAALVSDLEWPNGIMQLWKSGHWGCVIRWSSLPFGPAVYAVLKSFRYKSLIDLVDTFFVMFSCITAVILSACWEVNSNGYPPLLRVNNALVTSTS